jgi:hypothetical protein
LPMVRSFAALVMALVVLACAAILVIAVTEREADAWIKAKVSTYQRTNQAVLPPQDRPPEIVAYCDRGDKVTGGGHEQHTESGRSPLSAVYDKPVTGADGRQGWALRVFNPSYEESMTTTVYAICVDN